ncbi:MAG: cell division protein SepF [Armatimonadetes bacterium]|jgi:cell division inhibitor SepF|nr:cell division protein SepF [Armatimonadota bacterium]
MDRRDTRNLLDERDEGKNIFSKISDLLKSRDEEEEDDDFPSAGPGAGRTRYTRLDASRSNAIFVRLDFRSMEDAQAAADRLKERRPVIVNFERTDEEVARRGVDFISGVTYALDGFYQKVGDKVFLFTPSTTSISVEDASPDDLSALYRTR